jgi:phosphate transport system substrate-binding protein
MKNAILGLIALAMVMGLGGAVTMSGSTTVLPLGAALSEAYTTTKIDVTGGGTGAGMTALAAGTTDIAMASRVISKDEAAKMGTYSQNLIGYDGLIMITGGDVGVTSVTQPQLKAIFDGTYTNWKELGGSDLDIIAIGREGGSGTKETFLVDIMGDKTAECAGEQLICMSSAEILQAVKQTPGAIGYVGFSYAKGVNVLAYNDVQPSEETIKNKKYPLARELFLYTKQDASQEIKDFVNFALSPEGQKIAVENGYIPL